MIFVNWNIFEILEGSNEDNFEWLCYILFCKEFNLQKGLFRYKNQTAIETEPFNNIGFQCKYYRNTLSSYKNEIKKTIDDLSNNYPSVDILYFYTNSEWSETSRRSENNSSKSKVQEDLEIYSKNKNIEIKWLCLSYFERIVENKEYEYIFDFFFNAEKNKKNLEINKIIESNLKEELSLVNDFQHYRNNDSYINKIIKDNNSFYVIYGKYGSGKTQIIKELNQKKDENDLLIYFKLKDSNIFLDLDPSLYSDYCLKIFVIDDVNKDLTLKNKSFINNLVEKNWKVILLSYDIKSFKDNKYSKHEVLPLTNEEIKYILDKKNMRVPVDLNLVKILEKPLVLDQYINNYSNLTSDNLSQFYTKFWDFVIVKNNKKRELAILNMFDNHKDKECYYEEIQNMEKEGFLISEGRYYDFSSKLYGYIAKQKIIGEIIVKNSYKENIIIEELKSKDLLYSLPEWIRECNNETSDEYKIDFIIKLSRSEDEEIKSLVYKGIVKSNSNFVEKKILSSLNIDLVIENIIKYCGYINKEYLRETIDQIDNNYIVFYPNGDIWVKIINHIINNKIIPTDRIIEYLRKWVGFNYNKLEFKEEVRKIGLYVLGQYKKDSSLFRLTVIIAFCSERIIEEIDEFIDSLIKIKTQNIEQFYKYREFFSLIFNKVEGIVICRVFPDKVCALFCLFYKEYNCYNMNNFSCVYRESNFTNDCFIGKIPINTFIGILNNHDNYYNKNSDFILINNKQYYFTQEIWINYKKYNDVTSYIQSVLKHHINFIFFKCEFEEVEKNNFINDIEKKSNSLLIISVLLDIAFEHNIVAYIEKFLDNKVFYDCEEYIEKTYEHNYFNSRMKNALRENINKSNIIKILLKNDDKKNLIWTEFLFNLIDSPVPTYIEYNKYIKSKSNHINKITNPLNKYLFKKKKNFDFDFFCKNISLFNKNTKKSIIKTNIKLVPPEYIIWNLNEINDYYIKYLILIQYIINECKISMIELVKLKYYYHYKECISNNILVLICQILSKNSFDYIHFYFIIRLIPLHNFIEDCFCYDFLKIQYSKINNISEYGAIKEIIMAEEVDEIKKREIISTLSYEKIIDLYKFVFESSKVEAINISNFLLPFIINEEKIKELPKNNLLNFFNDILSKKKFFSNVSININIFLLFNKLLYDNSSYYYGIIYILIYSPYIESADILKIFINLLELINDNNLVVNKVYHSDFLSILSFIDKKNIIITKEEIKEIHKFFYNNNYYQMGVIEEILQKYNFV